MSCGQSHAKGTLHSNWPIGCEPKSIGRARSTIAGLAVKAQVSAIEGENDTQFADTTLASILRDMRALAKIDA
jgi:hypothetical protein